MGQFLDASPEAELVLLEPEELRVLRDACSMRMTWKDAVRLSLMDQLLLKEAWKKLEK